MTKEGVHDFSFKLHNQKHTFQAASTEERDGWLVAVESAAQHAHASSKYIVAGDDYKNSMTHFGKSHGLLHTTPRKKPCILDVLNVC